MTRLWQALDHKWASKVNLLPAVNNVAILESLLSYDNWVVHKYKHILIHDMWQSFDSSGADQQVDWHKKV